MEKNILDTLQIASPTSKTIPLLAVAATQSTGSATGNPRNKCALKPGHSLMDWIRLGNTDIDLSGTGGRIVAVTKEELSKHNTRNDAWMAIRGVVYNVTRYMDFHPGGVDELMRGVGTDATKIFNEIHAWVNYTQLLNKCRIGPLTNPVKLDPIIKQSPTLPNNKTTFDLFAKPPMKPMHEADIVPRLDWIQKRDDITLYFYTKQFCNPGAIIRNIANSDNRIEIWIQIAHNLHKYEFELEGEIKWPPKGVQISTESGKIEIKFHKHEEHLKLWSDLGKHKRIKILLNTLELEEFKIDLKKQYNHDSFVISLKNENLRYLQPVGFHLTIEGLVNHTKSSKCYTPVPRKYVEKESSDIEMLSQHFIIKRYPHNNSFSQYLSNLEKDAPLKVSLPQGNLNLTTLASHRRFCFLAAGSGLTPFLTLIDHLLKRNTNRIELLKLFYFNKSSTDIWCNDILTSLTNQDERFEFINILSNAEDSWTGLKGRVSLELLSPIVNKTMENISYICVCGPDGFVSNVQSILKGLDFPKENLFIF